VNQQHGPVVRLCGELFQAFKRLDMAAGGGKGMGNARAAGIVTIYERNGCLGRA